MRSTSPSPAALEIAQDLIRCGLGEEGSRRAQRVITERLTPLGFSAQEVMSGDNANLLLTRGGTGAMVIYSGHTDVVPLGEESSWTVPPCEGLVRDGFLYGRGAVDMRGGIACLIAALEGLHRDGVTLPYPLAVAIAGDEETSGRGSEALIERIKGEYPTIAACIVGEPSSFTRAGDAIRVGRRGSVTCKVSVKGIQGHAAYPEKIRNPNHPAIRALGRLLEIEWAAGPAGWPATSLQIASLKSGDGTANVIPEICEAVFNIRFGPHYTRDEIISKCEDAFAGEEHLTTKWSRGSRPYHNESSWLPDLVCAAVEKVTGMAPERSVAGGTSDGRHFAAAGIPTVELGTRGETLHQVDERVAIEDLSVVTQLYQSVLNEFI